MPAGRASGLRRAASGRPSFSKGKLAAGPCAWARHTVSRPATIADRPATIADGPAVIAEGPATIADGPATIADRRATIAGGRATVGGGRATVAVISTVFGRSPLLSYCRTTRFHNRTTRFHC